MVLVDLGKKKGSKLALKWHLKLIFSYNSVRPQKHYNSCIKFTILEGLGRPNLNKIGSKIDLKTRSR